AKIALSNRCSIQTGKKKEIYFLQSQPLPSQHVWSESEDCLPFLQLAQDYISSCGKKTLHEILEKVFKSFRPLLGLPDVDDDAFEEYNADVEEEEPEADHQQMGISVKMSLTWSNTSVITSRLGKFRSGAPVLSLGPLLAIYDTAIKPIALELKLQLLWSQHRLQSL
uniref:Maturin n=1 Tax=Crocodylus porosus TaxID=8502 RepID=A0A7M4EBH6_CROPO